MAITILSILQEYNSSETNPDEQEPAEEDTSDSTGEPIVYVWE